jgi:uncharacterized protein YcbX
VSDARIASLHLYPIKGCRGIDLPATQVADTGLVAEGVGDREWMVVDEAGRFLTQRELPRLALVETSVANARLRLAAPRMRALEVALSAIAGAIRNVVVWQSEVRGLDAGDAAASWLSEWLARDVRLVRFDRSVTRRCNPQYAKDSGAHTMFADGYPLLVASMASLADLNDRLAERGHEALPMNRFRPNVVVAGLEPYEEDHVDTLRIGDVVLRLVKPCTRCQVTTTDQMTAQVGIEPLRTLGEYRMDAHLDGVTFGVNAIVAAGGALARGMPVAAEYRF